MYNSIIMLENGPRLQEIVIVEIVQLVPYEVTSRSHQQYLQLVCCVSDKEDTSDRRTKSPFITKSNNAIKFCLKIYYSVTEQVEKLVRRVWSLLEHNNSSVRKAALETLSALPAQNNVELLQCSLRHIFQRALFEHCPPVTAVVKDVSTNSCFFFVTHIVSLRDKWIHLV